MHPLETKEITDNHFLKTFDRKLKELTIGLILADDITAEGRLMQSLDKKWLKDNLAKYYDLKNKQSICKQ
jgi:hypothetical protein